MFNPGIYRSYDIRGIVPDEFDPAEAYHIGRAYALHTDATQVVVARDMRPSGDVILPELMRGLKDAGVDVILIGQATTPLFYFAIHHLAVDGGLMVTASHNPGAYNGVKMARAEAVPIGGDSGLMEIRDLVQARQWPERKKPGSVREESVLAPYVEMATHGGDAGNLKVAIDAGNGMAGLVLPEVCRRLGGRIVPLYWEPDGTFPHHEANPLEEKNMQDLHRVVKEQGADIGVAFDGDADRVFFATEIGVTVPGDIATALIAKELLRENPGATILYDLRCSRTVKEVIEAAGGRAVMCKVGHSNIKAQMRQEKALFAGELSGHFYFTPWYAESGMLAMRYVLTMLAESGKQFSDLIAPLLRFAKTPEINLEVKDKAAVLRRVKEKYHDAELIELDGVTIRYANWWANIRGSNTEPLLRLNLEADTPELLGQKLTELQTLLRA